MIYSYVCNSCKATKDAVNRIAERRTNAPECCGEKMEIYISQAPMGFIDREIRYFCPVTSQGITSRYQRNEVMKRNGLADANDMVNRKTIADKVQKHQELQEFCRKHAPPPDMKEKVDRWAQQSSGL